MISDIRFYGEGANNYIELSIYLKFTGNDGATTDVTFRLLSGSTTVEQVVLELDDPCTEGGGFGGIGGGSCTYAVNVINFEIQEPRLPCRNGKARPRDSCNNRRLSRWRWYYRRRCQL